MTPEITPPSPEEIAEWTKWSALPGEAKTRLLAAYAAQAKEIERLTSTEGNKAFSDAAGLCESEARRWESHSDPRTHQHWTRIATILRGRHLAVSVLRKEIEKANAAVARLEAIERAVPAALDLVDELQAALDTLVSRFDSTSSYGFVSKADLERARAVLGKVGGARSRDAENTRRRNGYSD